VQPDAPAPSATTATTPPGDGPGAAASSSAPGPGTIPPAEIRPLDDQLRQEIRDEIAETRARQLAQERLDKALQQVRTQVDNFARELRRREFQTPPPSTQQQPLALSSLQHDELLTMGETPLVDALSVKQYELGETSQLLFTSWPPQQIQFSDVAFIDGVPLYSPAQIGGTLAANTFLFWKTADEEPFVPEFSDVRDDVVEAWKRREALTLAKARADELVKQARQATGGLADAFGETAQIKVLRTQPFSWMSTGLSPAGMGPPALSTVELTDGQAVDGAGEDFMRAVFALRKGEIGPAVNQPQNTVYVVRIAEQTPEETELRERFLQSGVTIEVSQIADAENMELRIAWYEDLDAELGVQWLSPTSGAN
jgi:hypothetical protein